jgi:hypothetical protein
MPNASKNGAYFWWLVRAVPALDKNVIKWFGTCTDIQNIKETGIRIKKLKNTRRIRPIKICFSSQHESRDTHPMNGILGFADLLKEPD